MSYSRALVVLPVIFFITVSAAASLIIPSQTTRTICAAALSAPGDCAGAVPHRVALAPLATNVISLWGGARESIALKSDGTVWTWGLNNCALGNGSCGKLGDGTLLQRNVPVQVHGPGDVGYLNSVTAIMGGEHHNYALKADGTLWAWGGNFVGQLGDGTYTNTDTPVQVNGLSAVMSLGGRGYHSLAVKADGTVWAWGWNSRGQLGHDTSASPCPAPFAGTCSNVPVQVIGITNPLTVTGGGFFSLALMPDHTLRSWGANESGQLGDGTTTDRSSPVQVSSVLSNVVQVSAGWKHAVALTSDGKVWTWGDNTYGQIGNGITSTVGVSVPLQVSGLSNVIGVSGGDRFTAALQANGTVWTWGWNGFGQLGDGTNTDRAVPVLVHNLSNVTLLAARDYHDLVVRADGSVWAWGSGGNGELGNNNPVDSNLPVQILFPPTADTPTPTATGNLTPTNPPTPTSTATGTPSPTPTATGTNDTVTDLSITKQVKQVTATQHKYKLRVTNQGIYPAVAVQVTDRLPKQYKLDKVRAPGLVCQTAGRQITCNLAALNPGAQIKIVIMATSNGATGKNCGQVTASTPDANLANNRACVKIPLATFANSQATRKRPPR